MHYTTQINFEVFLVIPKIALCGSKFMSEKVGCPHLTTGFPPHSLAGKSGKTGENIVVKGISGNFCFQKFGKHFLNADYCEIKKCHNFHLKNVAIIISCYS